MLAQTKFRKSMLQYKCEMRSRLFRVWCKTMCRCRCCRQTLDLSAASLVWRILLFTQYWILLLSVTDRPASLGSLAENSPGCCTCLHYTCLMIASYFVTLLLDWLIVWLESSQWKFSFGLFTSLLYDFSQGAGMKYVFWLSGVLTL